MVRIYFETVKRWGLAVGISSASAVFLIFLYLSTLRYITITGHSGDMVCAGTLDNPCYAYINFTANQDIFIYPVGYDPWGRNTPFNFTPGIKDWKLQRSWGKGWRDIPLDKPCTGIWCGAPSSTANVTYSIVFKKGQSYQIRVIGYKNSPFDNVKWGFADLDPWWYGTIEKFNITDKNNATIWYYRRSFNNITLTTPVHTTCYWNGSEWRDCEQVVYIENNLADIDLSLIELKVKPFSASFQTSRFKNLVIEYPDVLVKGNNTIHFKFNYPANQGEEWNLTFTDGTNKWEIDPDISACSVLDTAYGVYTLTADIINSANTYCMNISANHVILDCQGHTIDGTDASSTYGIYVYRSSATTTNETIKNCIVTDWYDGIYLVDSDSNTLSNITSNSNTYNGIHFYVSSSNTLSNITANSNSYYGIFLYYYSNSNTIKNSIIQGNSQYGIYLYTAGIPANLIYNNLFNNTNNFYFAGTIYANNWNTTRQTGSRIYSPGTEIGGNYWTNPTGNGYSDTCTDSNKDGFCDSYYELSATGPNRDYLPLSDEYPDTTPPTYSLNSTNSTYAGTPVSHNLYWNDNTALHPKGQYQAWLDNCTGSFVNVTPKINFTSTPQWSNFTAAINTTVDCTIRWFVNATDDAGNLNNTGSTSPFSYVTTSANTAPTLSNIWESPTDPATYVFGATYRFNVTACDVNGATDINTTLFEWGGVNTTVTDYVTHNATCRNYTTTKTDLAAQTATSYKWYANDSANAWASLSDSYTVNKATPSLSLTLSPSSTVTYPTQTTATGSESNSGDADLTYNLYRNNVLKSNPETITLGAGSYSYVYNTSGGTNYTSNSISSTLTVNKGGVNIDIYFTNSTNTITNSNMTMWWDEELNATATINITEQNTFYLYQDGTQVGTQTGAKIEYYKKLKPGTYYFNSTYPGNENYTSFTRDPYVKVDPWIQWIKTYDETGTETSYFFAGEKVTIKTNITVPNDLKTDLDEVNLTLKNPGSTIMISNETTFKFWDDFVNNNWWNVQTASSSWSIDNGRYKFSNTTEYHAITIENETKNYMNLTIEAKVNLTSSTEDSIRLIFRYENKTDYSALFLTKYYSAFGIEDWVGGTRYATEVSKLINLNQIYTMKVVVEGDKASAFLDGVNTTIRTLNSSRVVAGKVGLGADASTVLFDNYTVTSPDSSVNIINSKSMISITNYTIPEVAASEGTWNINSYVAAFDGEYSSDTDTFEASYSAPLIETLNTYNSTYAKLSVFHLDEKVIVRANITDPQGAGDLDTVLINLTNPQKTIKVTNAKMSNVTSITSGYTYEYNYTIPAEYQSYGDWAVDVFVNDTSNNKDTRSTTFKVEVIWFMIYKPETAYEQWYNTNFGDNITYIKSIEVSDIDNDGTNEIITFGRSHNGTGTNHAMLQVWNASRTDEFNLTLNKEAETYFYKINHTFGYSVFAYDIDGDGTKELVTGGVAYNNTYNLAYLGVWNYTGGTLKEEDYTTWLTVDNTAVYGVYVWNNSGAIKIITIGESGGTDKVQTRVWNYTNGILNLEDSNNWGLGYDAEGYVIKVADPDEDGTEEIVTAGYVSDGTRLNGFIRIYNYTSMTLTVENTTYFYKNSITEIFGLDIGDVDRDGHPEIVTSGNWYDGTRDNLHVRVWNYSANKLTLQHEYSDYIAGHASLLTVIVKDVDRDEEPEIIGVGFMNDGVLDRGYRVVLDYNSSTGYFRKEAEKLWEKDDSVRDGDFSDAAKIADVDGNGALDLVSGGRYKMTTPAGTFIRIDSFSGPDLKVGLSPGIYALQFEPVSKDIWANCTNCSATYGCLNVTNNGTEPASMIEIKVNESAPTGYTLECANNSAYLPSVTVNTTYQEIYSTLENRTSFYVWCRVKEDVNVTEPWTAKLMIYDAVYRYGQRAIS
jgi:parallel beta-helix repeat protein